MKQQVVSAKVTAVAFMIEFAALPVLAILIGLY